MSKKVPKVIYRKLGKEKCWGLAEHDPRFPRIEIDPRLGAKRALETLCHEQLHISLGLEVSESKIDRIGKEICETLWRQNYRQVLLQKHSTPVRISK